jgi:endonuclease G
VAIKGLFGVLYCFLNLVNRTLIISLKMKNLVLAFLFFVSLGAFAEQAKPLPIDSCIGTRAPYGLILSKKSNTTVVCRAGYVLEHDNTAHIPIWVSYDLEPINAIGCLPRSDAFATDESLAPGAASTMKDYSKSGYDTGHMANDGDFRWNAQRSKESFILSNMAPQLPAFNRGIWKRLEGATRGWAISRGHTLVIYVGPIYSRDQDLRLKNSDVTIPHSFFKIIIDQNSGETLAFIFNHEGSSSNLQTFMTSVPEIQRQTGLVIPLPSNAKLSSTLWPIVLKNATSTKKVSCSLK